MSTLVWSGKNETYSTISCSKRIYAKQTLSVPGLTLEKIIDYSSKSRTEAARETSLGLNSFFLIQLEKNGGKKEKCTDFLLYKFFENHIYLKMCRSFEKVA